MGSIEGLHDLEKAWAQEHVQGQLEREREKSPAAKSELGLLSRGRARG